MCQRSRNDITCGLLLLLLSLRLEVIVEIGMMSIGLQYICYQSLAGQFGHQNLNRRAKLRGKEVLVPRIYVLAFLFLNSSL